MLIYIYLYKKNIVIQFVFWQWQDYLGIDVSDTNSCLAFLTVFSRILLCHHKRTPPYLKKRGRLFYSLIYLYVKEVGFMKICTKKWCQILDHYGPSLDSETTFWFKKSFFSLIFTLKRKQTLKNIQKIFLKYSIYSLVGF